jgi:hypothetical protein
MFMPEESKLKELLSKAEELKKQLQIEIEKNPSAIKELAPAKFTSGEQLNWCVINVCGGNLVL